MRSVNNMWGLNIKFVSNIEAVEKAAEVSNSITRHEYIGGGDNDEE